MSESVSAVVSTGAGGRDPTDHAGDGIGEALPINTSLTIAFEEPVWRGVGVVSEFAVDCVGPLAPLEVLELEFASAEDSGAIGAMGYRATEVVPIVLTALVVASGDGGVLLASSSCHGPSRTKPVLASEIGPETGIRFSNASTARARIPRRRYSLRLILMEEKNKARNVDHNRPTDLRRRVDFIANSPLPEA